MNRLAKERSPYLLQHAANPVDWYPWGDEAFERARTEDKPIFVSIGYSTCHWCHVMEHESFEDSSIADAAQPRFHFDQSRPGRASRCGPGLHVVRPVDDRLRRLADDGLSDAATQAVLRWHLFPPDVQMGPSGVLGSSRRDHTGMEHGPASSRRGCRRADRTPDRRHSRWSGGIRGR